VRELCGRCRQYLHAAAGSARPHLGEQPGLADARRALDNGQASVLVASVRQHRLQRRRLVAALE